MTTWGLLVPGAGRVPSRISNTEREFLQAVNAMTTIGNENEDYYTNQRRHEMGGVSTDYSKHSNQRITAADLDNMFTYHAPKGDQQERYVNLREIAKELAILMVKYCPPCADTTAAIRQLRESVMSANAAIACNE